MEQTEIPSAGAFRNLSRELSALIERVASRDKDEETERTLKRVQDKLHRHIQKAAFLMQSLRVMRGGSLVSAKDLLEVTDKLDSFAKKIVSLQTRLKNERSKLLANDTWALCDKEADALAKALAEKLQASWRQFVASETRSTEGFQPFRSLQGCAAVLSDLDKLTRRLLDHQNQLPDSAAAVTAVKEMGAQMDVEIAKLKVEGIPAAVLAFLKQAAMPGGISAAQLTDEILACLRDRQFVGSLRIVPGTAAGNRIL